MKNLNSLLVKSLTLCFFITGMLSVNAQERDEPKLGAKAGINISNVYDTEGEDFTADNKLGYVVGGFLSIPLGNVLGIQPEVLYSRKGFKSTGTFLGSQYELKRTTSHLDIPIQLAIKPSSALTLLAGPQYSYTLTQKDEVDFPLGGITNTEEFDNDNVRKNTLGVVGGFDVNLSKIILSGRAGWDLQKNNGDGSSSDIRYRNFWLQFTVGINIL